MMYLIKCSSLNEQPTFGPRQIEDEDARVIVVVYNCLEVASGDVNEGCAFPRYAFHGTRCVRTTKCEHHGNTTRNVASPMAAPTTTDLSTNLDIHVCWKVDVKAH